MTKATKKATETSRMSQNDIKMKVENQILDMMKEKNVLIWQCPWAFAARDMAYKGRKYRGVNSVILAMSRIYHGYNSHVWFTMSKINELNGMVWDEESKKMKRDKWVKKFYNVRINTKATPVVFWSWKEAKENGEVVRDKNGNPKVYPLLRYYCVYNASQIVGLEDAIDSMEPCAKVLDKEEALSAEDLEKELLSHYKDAPEIVHNADKASYIPDFDKVYIPAISSFGTKAEYISTLAHELGHSTGHKSRLNRLVLDKMLDPKKELKERAKEELVAEFTAAFITAHYGLEGKPTDNSAAYIQHWFKTLEENPGLLYEAIGQAEKAFEKIMGEEDEQSEE